MVQNGAISLILDYLAARKMKGRLRIPGNESTVPHDATKPLDRRAAPCYHMFELYFREVS